MAQGMKPGQEYSTDPKAVRNRLRARARKIGTVEADMEKHLAMLPHYRPVEEWDMEELARGRPRGVDGYFHGPRPPWLTPTVRAEAQRRLKEYAGELLSAEVGNAIKVMAQLMMDESVDDFGTPVVPAKVKIDAAKFIIEQVRGKAKQIHEVDAGPGVREMLAEVLILPGGGKGYDPRVIDQEEE